jgi:PhnB protein
MTTRTRAIPEGFHTLTPHLIVKGAAQAIEFYKKAFSAEEINGFRDQMASPSCMLT